MALMDPRGTVDRIYKEDHYTLLRTKYESSGPCGFLRRRIFIFSHCMSMGANDPRDGAIFYSRDMVGMINKEDHYILLHTKYKRSGPCSHGEDFNVFFCFFFLFFFFFMTPPGRARMGPRGTVSRSYKEDHYTLLHTTYKSSGSCSFGDVFPMTPPGQGPYGPQGQGWQDL